MASKKTTGRKVGRPTKYDPKYCQELIDFMGKGYSFECFGFHIGVAQSTVEDWVNAHEEFRGAKKQAFTASRMFWEKAAVDNLTHYKDGKQLNSTVWIFNMKNRFGWTDKKQVDVEVGKETRKSFAFDLSKSPDEIDESE